MNAKQQAFDRILARRLPNAIKAIELLGNLSNRGNYDFTEQQAVNLVRQIDQARDSLAKSFKIDQRTQKQPIKEPETGKDPGFDSLEPINSAALCWVSWALERIQRNDIKAGKEMLITGIKLSKEKVTK